MYQSLILVVDDQQIGRFVLSSLLEPEGYRLAFAANGVEAISQAQVLRPDLVLLDVMMPVMDGFAVCRYLRADPRTAEIPIIMVTALDDQESLMEGLAAGADDFIRKPFHRAELRARVGTIVRLNRYRHLWAQRERYAQLVERAPNGVVIIDTQHTIRLANRAFAHMLAVEPAALSGQALGASFAADRWHELQNHLEALDTAQIDQIQLESILVDRHGERRLVSVDAGRCEWDDFPAYQLLIRDITDQKRAELLDLEQRQVAYELHDGAAQLVTSIYQRLQLFTRRHRLRSPAALADLAELQHLAQQAVREIRHVLEGLRPSALDDFGLVGAFHMLVESLRQDGWELALDTDDDRIRLPPAHETALFRIAQEALTNTAKHAGVRRAAIRLERTAHHVQLTIRDWGKGFNAATDRPPAGLGQRLGLRAMRERATLLGGEFALINPPGSGVTIQVTLPLPPTNPPPS